MENEKFNMNPITYNSTIKFPIITECHQFLIANMILSIAIIVNNYIDLILEQCSKAVLKV